MLLFSTLLDINDSMTKDAFIQLVIEWNQGSPHANNTIPNIQWNGEHNVHYGNENLWLDIQEYRNQNTIAVRYEKKESDGVVWDTDYVMNFNTMKMSIRLDRSYLEEALTTDSKFSTPYFITLLIERGYLKDDGDLPVLRTPSIVEDDDIARLAHIMNGDIRYRLPVVYISKTYQDESPVNAESLAANLKGVAHVLVQKSISQNQMLMDLCDQKNEYNGAIGIYYPNSVARHKRYLYYRTTGVDSFLTTKVIRSVIQHSNVQMVNTLYTWQGVSNALLRDQLANQRNERLAAEHAKEVAERETLQLLDSLDDEQHKIRKQAMEDARAEANELLAQFDEDISKLQRQIDLLTRENESLQYENLGLRTKLNATDASPLLYMGNEDEFYAGEIKDLILSTLTDSIPNITLHSRRMDVVTDIIENNNYQKVSEKRTDTVKKLLKNYTGMSGRLRQELMDLGFEITEDGKHYKLTYFKDGRYGLTLAKTPSDHRAGMNNSCTISNICF